MAEILQGAAALLWPLIAIILIVILIALFRPNIAAIIKSAETRKVTLKIGNQELTLEEADKQQRNLIADIQSQVVELRRNIEGITGTIPALPESAKAERSAQRVAILWVDDNPKNNGYLVQQFLDMGLTVDLALSTSDGLKRFDEGQYEVVISDMGRREEGSYKGTAGLSLLKEIRAINPDVPFIIFSTSTVVREYRSKAIAAGATSITSSPTELFGILQRELIGA